MESGRPTSLAAVDVQLRPFGGGFGGQPPLPALPGPSGPRRRPAKPPIGERLFSLYATLIGPLLGWYMMFDKAGAYIHIPGTPLYLGEMLLLVGVGGAVFSTRYLRLTIRDEPMLFLLGVFMLWGLARTVPEVSHYHMAAFRDAALWYYGLFALFICTAARVRPDVLTRMVRGFSRLLPWLLWWLPIALILPRVHNIPVKVPFSPVSILEHRATNVGVVALFALAYLWLVPDHSRSEKTRLRLSLLALLDIALAGTQSRGGFGAAGIAIIIALVFGFVPHAARWVVRVIVIGVVSVALVLLLSLSVSTGGGKGTPGQGRSVSVSQLFNNIVSVSGSSAAGNQGNLQGALVFRDELWSRVLAQQIKQNKIPMGFGFGANLGTVAGFGQKANNANLELQSPHNSHLDVFARMGVVGAVMWVFFWLAWVSRLIRGRRRLRYEGADVERGVLEVCLLSVIAILVACTFDPTLESAQMAANLWTMTGIGLLLSSPKRSVSVAAPEAEDGPGVLRRLTLYIIRWKPSRPPGHTVRPAGETMR